MQKLTLTQLKKQLAHKSKEELIKEIGVLYQKFPQVKEYFFIQTNDTQSVLQKYKEIIEKEFIEGKTRGLPKVRFSVARKAVNDFKKLTDDPMLIADLMFTYVESVSWFNKAFAPDVEEFYTRPEYMFEEALELLQKHGLEHAFQKRAYDIVDNAVGAWGHQDSFRESYSAVYDSSDT